jgi:hypothetical protein
MLISDYQQRQQRISEKRRTLLRFLRQETWSSAEVLQSLLGLSNTGTYKTLSTFERDNLITSHYLVELKYRIWGISPTGLFYAWDENEQMEDRPTFQPSKVKAVMVRHHLDLQLARLQAEKTGWYTWTLEGDLPKGISKRPDAVVTNLLGERIAVELERTVKTQKRYEVIFSDYLQAIKAGEYQSVHYVCPDPEFARRLHRLFQQIESVPIANQRVTINDKHRNRLPVFALSNWPPQGT